MAVEEDGVAKDGARREDAHVGGPLDGRLAVPALHLAKFDHALCDMHRVGKAAFDRGSKAFAQQFLGAGIDLRRADDAVQAARRMLLEAIHERERGIEALAARLLVPDVAEAAVAFHLPARGGEAGREIGAQSALCHQRRPAVPDRAEVDERGDSALEQFAVGKFGAGRTHRVVVRRIGLRALVESCAELSAQAVLFANAAVGRLATGMRMHVDESGHGHQPAAVDLLVRRSGIARPDVREIAA
jgi:hypothetical protein